jgi:hypothetical protein
MFLLIETKLHQFSKFALIVSVKETLVWVTGVTHPYLAYFVLFWTLFKSWILLEMVRIS